MKTSLLHRATIAAMACVVVAGTIHLSAEQAAAQFGFRGGFRGGFGRSSFSRGRSSFGRSSFSRGRSSFGRSNFGRSGLARSSSFRGSSRLGSSRFGSFRRSGFRGFSSFGRSRFNSLAFRGRRFGNSGFNSFNRSSRFRRYGFAPRRVVRFVPRYRYGTFAVNHFPVQRFHSGFGSFQTVSAPRYSPRGLVVSNSPVLTQPAFTYTSVSGTGWDQLAQGQPLQASQTFASTLNAGQAGHARVGFALAAADSGDLNQGVWAMRRAFALDCDSVCKMLLDEKLRPTAERVTRAYEERMSSANSNMKDDAFMLAAMYQMQGDPEMATMAMDYVKKANAFDEGSRNLNKVIGEQMKSIPMTTSAAWKVLADGNYTSARDMFVTEIGADADAGVPKLGFALASAAMGDLETGTWAIKRAFENDPESVSDVVLDGKLRPMVRTLIEKYEIRVPDPTTNQDDAMTLATLYQLQGDVEAAAMMAKALPNASELFPASMIMEEMKMTESMMEEAMKSDKPVLIQYPPESSEMKSAELQDDPPLPEIDLGDIGSESTDGLLIPPAPGELVIPALDSELPPLPTVIKEEPPKVPALLPGKPEASGLQVPINR